MNAFAICKLEKWWCVVERPTTYRRYELLGRAKSTSLVLVSYHETREEARDAARQLNKEEQRGRR